ncbi:MAG TPA: hypothetical protein VMV46_07160 [Thermoanaerobaculia bacterium]|nr:hypothetical protein [Thermoanaerobaculia bacterium]
MKSIVNKTHRPLKIRLAQGRVLHLGPGKVGQIATGDAEREAFKNLVESGAVEIVGEGSGPTTPRGETVVGHADARGHHASASSVVKRGDR